MAAEGRSKFDNRQPKEKLIINDVTQDGSTPHQNAFGNTSSGFANIGFSEEELEEYARYISSKEFEFDIKSTTMFKSDNHHSMKTGRVRE